MELKTYYVVVVSLVSTGAVLLVLSFSLASIFFVYAAKTIFAVIVQTIAVLLEICVALIAAVCSGATVSLTVLASAGASSMTLPASLIEARIGVSVLVSCTAILTAAAALFWFTAYSTNWEVEAAVVGAGAVAVSAASAWAVGVTSLIEKETQAVGVKMTSILDVVRQNKYNLLKILVKLQVGLKQRELNLALLHAVKAGYPECVEVLLENGADANYADSNNNSLLIIACDTGCERNVRMLLEHGCDPNRRNSGGSTPIHYAGKWGYDRCVELLLACGAGKDMQDGQWNSPLMLACCHAYPAEKTMRVLINAGCDVNIAGTTEHTALHYAASRDLDVTILLNAGANALHCDAEGNSALHFAAKEGCTKVIRDLLKVGCDPQKANSRGRTSLHLASQRGELPCISALIEAGANCDTRDPAGNLPIWYAAANSRFEAVRYFIVRNCPVRSYQFNSRTVHVTNPLIPAMEKKYFHIVKLLVIAGCDHKMLSDWLLETPEDCWWESYIDIIHWLRSYLSQPISLAHSCRLTIRRSLGGNPVHKSKTLPLPLPLLRYVSMEDLDKHAVRPSFYSSFYKTDSEVF